jgi:NAD(P)-dependent dehydrogenase (short-subunit alcohol dehydrogenase family)
MWIIKELKRPPVTEFGRIDILVNTAGGTSGAGPFPQAQEAKWERDININFLGSMYCAKAVLSGMMERKYGKIVNFSSGVAISGMPGSSSYAGAKAAVIAFTKCLALEVGRMGINVNCLAPTMVMTNFGTHATMDPKRAEEMAARMTLGRLTTTQDIANTVVFLVSDISGGITGQVISF